MRCADRLVVARENNGDCSRRPLKETWWLQNGGRPSSRFFHGCSYMEGFGLHHRYRIINFVAKKCFFENL